MKYTPVQAQVIFRDALRACGRNLEEIADELAANPDGLTGDDHGDDFAAVIDCAAWLENMLNLNNDFIPFKEKFDPKNNEILYTNEEWLPAVLEWVVDNYAHWSDADAELTEDDATFNPQGNLIAWSYPGAPTCQLTNLFPEP